MLAALNLVITRVITIPIARRGDVGAGIGDRLPGPRGHVAPALGVFPGGKAEGLEPTLGSAYLGLCDLRGVTQPL